MGSSSDLHSVTTPSAVSHAWTSFWRLPSMTIARFTLRSYMRSGWILLDIVFVWFMYALLFFEFGGNVSYFFSTTGQGLGVLAILGTIVMVQRAMSARVYLPLARLSSRSSYVRGLILATGVLRIPIFLLMLLLGAGYHAHSPVLGIQGATPGNMIPGSIGLIINCIIISTLTVMLSIPIATRTIQIVFLIWLAAVLYANSNPGIVAAVLSITHLPLVPLAICYNLSTSSFDWYTFLLALIAIAYIPGFTWLAEFWLSRRDLNRL